WTRAHTRLLVRAVEWHEHGRETSRLLRGADLVAAEQWLAQGADHEPRPGDLQRDFILAGRLEHGRRSRRLIAAISTALIVAVALGLAAWIQRQEAVNQRNLADRNRLDAERQSVAALTNLSIASLRQGREVDALVAALRAGAIVEREVAFREPSLDRYRTLMTLRRAAFATHERNYIVTRAFRGVTQVAFAPGDATLLAVTGGGEVASWSLAGVAGPAFRTEHYGISDGCTSVAGFAVAKDGTLITLGNDGTLAQWSPDGRNRGRIDLQPYGGGDGQCSAIVWAAIDARVGRVTVRDWRGVTTYTLGGRPVAKEPAGEPVDADFQRARLETVTSPSGRYRASVTTDGMVVVTRKADDGYSPDVEIMRLPGQRSPAFSHDERRLATVSAAVDQSVVHLWDVQALDAMAPDGLTVPEASTSSRTVSLDGREVAVDTGVSVREQAAVVSRDGLAVARIADVQDGRVEVWRAGAAGEALTLAQTIDTDQLASADFSQALQSLAFSPDGRVLATGGSDGSVKLWNEAGKEVGRLVAHPSQAAAQFSDDGLVVLTWTDTPGPVGVKVWSTGGQELDAFAAPDWARVRFVEDGTGNTWIVARAETGERGRPDIIRAWPLDPGRLIAAGCGLLRLYLANPAAALDPGLSGGSTCTASDPPWAMLTPVTRAGRGTQSGTPAYHYEQADRLATSCIHRHTTWARDSVSSPLLGWHGAGWSAPQIGTACEARAIGGSPAGHSTLHRAEAGVRDQRDAGASRKGTAVPMRITLLHSGGGARTFAVVFSTGDDPIAGLKSVAAEHGVTAAALTGIGACSGVVLGYFDWARKAYSRIEVPGQVEVLALTGNIGRSGDSVA
ncbi:MAG: DUF296 domain-containing protein, partial [Vicinamibacterales bacterium]